MSTGAAFGFCDDLIEVFAQSVVDHAAVNGNVEVRNIGKFDGVVGMCKDGFAQVFAHFFRIDVKGGGKIQCRGCDSHPGWGASIRG